MKKICLVLSALALCCTMLIGAGAAGTSSQMSLTQQAITHFQQSPPEKDTTYPEHTAWKSWQIDSCEVLPCRLIEEKDIWKLIFTPSDYSSRWVCAVDLSAGTIVTPLFDGLDGQIWKCADDQLLLEHSDTYQLCDLNGSLTDISIPHAGHVMAVDDQGYVLCQYPVPRTVRTDSGTMNDTFCQYTLLGPDFTVLQDGIDQYYNVGQYDYSYDSELFYNGLAAVRVGASDWYLPDGGQFNAQPVTESKALTARWGAQPVDFTVEHYYMDTTGNMPSAASESDQTRKDVDTDIEVGTLKKSGLSEAFTCVKARVSGVYGLADDTEFTDLSATVRAAKGMTVKLYYNRAQYALEWVFNGGTASNDYTGRGGAYEIYYDTALILPEPAKRGHDFGGWFDNETFNESGKLAAGAKMP